MKSLIIYHSHHHQNTEKVARAIGEELGADRIPVDQIRSELLGSYDLLGLGSGIYYGKVHASLLQLVETLPPVTEKWAFVFSTSGEGGTRGHGPLKELLARRGFTIIGEFSCKGWDSRGPYKIIGGINKDRPSEEDLDTARKFAQGLREQMSSVKEPFNK